MPRSLWKYNSYNQLPFNLKGLEKQPNYESIVNWCFYMIKWKYNIYWNYKISKNWYDIYLETDNIINNEILVKENLNIILKEYNAKKL